ncbi:hypothetical protein BuS5_03855 [Desulfosarcina sp. BuS5]|nr:hypothetical protein BuS5_03855 [Desulfosarcina sp. BuS5]
MIYLKRIKIKTRAQHIWILGVLMWGVPTAILFLLIGYFLFKETFLLSRLIISFIAFSIAGYCLGIWTWKLSQKKTER